MPPPSFMQEHLFTSIDEGLAEHERDHVFRLRFGRGNWRYFQILDYELAALLTEAERWGEMLAGIEWPWLCWNISHEWCLVQQQLVRDVGWTPVVGYDPRVGPPPRVVDGAVVVDFNERLRLPVLQMQFVVDFAFLLAPRLAFWHSDLLCRPERMRWLSHRFRELEDGAMAMCEPTSAWWRRLLRRELRYFEVVGCMTRGASRRNFQTGCGLWRGFAYHPNCPDARSFAHRRRRYWDHGSGIKYWRDHHRGNVRSVPETLIDEGHFSRISTKGFQIYTAKDTRHSGIDLEANVSLEEACETLELGDVFRRHLGAAAVTPTVGD